LEIRNGWVAICALALSTATISAQGGAGVAADLKQSYNGVKNNILSAAEKMPDADYSFQPTAPERSFGGWVAHVADAQIGACSRIAGSSKQPGSANRTSKADLMAALKESFEICDAVYEGTTDANLNDLVPSFRGQTPRASALYGNIAHDQECYGTMAVYLRLKGLVPPSTEAMMRGRGGKK
jgi:uncharacterized damage-inducible protein DinB